LRATSPKASPTLTNSNWSAPVYEGTNTTASFLRAGNEFS
jgi:hypothetical protein